MSIYAGIRVFESVPLRTQSFFGICVQLLLSSLFGLRGSVIWHWNEEFHLCVWYELVSCRPYDPWMDDSCSLCCLVSMSTGCGGARSKSLCIAWSISLEYNKSNHQASIILTLSLLFYLFSTLLIFLFLTYFHYMSLITYVVVFAILCITQYVSSCC